MNKRTISALAATAAACAIGAAPAAASADVNQATSANWSGYVASAASGSHFKSVSSTWVQPTASCDGGQTYSAFWVGLGGGGSAQALEQAGTEANCGSDGTAQYYAWYELVPAAPVQVSLAVKPGDRVLTRVAVTGSTVAIAITNQTTGATFSKTLQMSNPDVSTAEWIAEAPSACDQSVSNCSPLSLTDFGSMKFINAHATTADGHTGTISDSNWSATAVSLGSDGTTLGATPGSLSSDGSSFAVSASTATGSAGSDPNASGTGYGYSDGGGYTGGDTGGYGYSSGDGYSGGDGYGGGYGGGGMVVVVPGSYGDGGYAFTPSDLFGS